MTPYERRIDQIQKEIIQQYGEETLSFIQTIDEGFLRMSLAGYTLKKSLAERTERERQLYQMMLWYVTQIDEAKKLWSKADQEKKDKLNTEERWQEEAMHLKKSNYKELVRGVSKAFNEWQTKGEFEKRVDYDQRLKDSSAIALDRICLEEILKKEHYLSGNTEVKLDKDAARTASYYSLHIGRFDADREVYPVYSYDFTGEFPCPTETAKEISGDTHQIKIKASDFHLAMCNDGLILGSIKIEVLDRDNKVIYSRTLNNDNKEGKVLPLEIKREFLEIEENPYLKDYVFTYK